MYNPKLKLISFKSSEHINETGDGPYRGFSSNSQLFMYIVLSYVIFMLFTSCNLECNKVSVYFFSDPIIWQYEAK